MRFFLPLVAYLALDISSFSFSVREKKWQHWKEKHLHHYNTASHEGMEKKSCFHIYGANYIG